MVLPLTQFNWPNSRRAVANHHCLDWLATCRVWMEQWSTWETKPRSHYQPLWDSPWCKVDVEKKWWMAATMRLFDAKDIEISFSFWESSLKPCYFWTTLDLFSPGDMSLTPACVLRRVSEMVWLEMVPKPNGSQSENNQHEFANS